MNGGGEKEEFGIESAAMENPSSGDSSSEKPHHVSRQVTKFEDHYGMVLPYCGYFGFEIDPDNYDYREGIDLDDEEAEVHDTNHVEEPIPTLTKYVAQIRKSFGFDVDCVAPSRFEGVFVPFDLSEGLIKFPEYYKKVVEATEFAMAEINSDTRKTSGETYELVELVKLVRGRPWKKLLTLKVKEVKEEVKEEGEVIKTIQALVYEGMSLELLQWRFKPIEDEPWYEPPPIEEEYPFLKSDAVVASSIDDTNVKM